MTADPSRMARELAEAPEAIAGQAAALSEPLAELVRHLERQPPRVVVTCARGSSGHAATFAKHLIEHRFGIPVAAAAPSIASVYHRRLRLDGQLFLAISQSGQSDDILAQADAASEAGALTVALVNRTDSPLAKQSDIVLPMCAGAEQSVAATKSFIASVVALLRLIALWADENKLARALDRLPDRLRAAAQLEWSAAPAVLVDAASLITVGRGPTLAIAREAALKLKETCNLHAEAFSGAELRHGPIALVATRYPIILFMPTDAAAPGMRALAAELADKDAAVFTAGPDGAGARQLPGLPPDHPDADAVCLIQSHYAMTERLARRLGFDVDRPRHLEKVTRTR